MYCREITVFSSAASRTKNRIFQLWKDLIQLVVRILFSPGDEPNTGDGHHATIRDISMIINTDLRSAVLSLPPPPSTVLLAAMYYRRGGGGN